MHGKAQLVVAYKNVSSLHFHFHSYFPCNRFANTDDVVQDQARKQLGTPGGANSFLKGDQIFYYAQ